MSFSDVERQMDAAVARRVFPGAVLLVREGTRVFYLRAFGHRSLEPELTPMGEDTIFGTAVSIEPGTIIGAGCKVSSGSKITRNLPNRSLVT